MSDQDNVVKFKDIKAKAAGVPTELMTVIEQINERFGVQIDIHDQRLERFKWLYPALNAAAEQKHEYHLDGVDEARLKFFKQGVDVGKAQMMTDVIVCVLELDGLVERKD